jgi:hypothetical protein
MRMSYDEDHFLEAVKSPSGQKRLAAVLQTMSLEEIQGFATEISESLKTLIHNDEKAAFERIQLLVTGIAKFAADPTWNEADV